MWKDGYITATDFARLIRISRPTLYKYVQEFETGTKYHKNGGDAPKTNLLPHTLF